MSENFFRVQFLRGTTVENDAYTGRAGEVTFDVEKNQLRLHDGVAAGGNVMSGGGPASITIQCNSWNGNQFTVPEGITVAKEYSDSSLRIVHGMEKYPTAWYGFNRESEPMVGLVPSSVRNIQIVDLNTVIITSLSSLERFDLSLHFS